MAVRISLIDLLGKAPFNKATAPATCGAAILVPVKELYPELFLPVPLFTVLNILVPGAAMSTVVKP